MDKKTKILKQLAEGNNELEQAKALLRDEVGPVMMEHYLKKGDKKGYEKMRLLGKMPAMLASLQSVMEHIHEEVGEVEDDSQLPDVE